MQSTVLAQNATQLAISSPETVDIDQLVKMLALRKADEHGRKTLSSQRGKQSVFSAVCAWVKTLRGIGKGEQLSETEAASIKTRVEAFFETQVKSILAEYDRLVIRTGGLVARVGKKTGVTTEAFATIKGARDCRSNEEKALACLLTINQKESQINRILDKPAQDDDDREMLRKLGKQIESLREYRAKMLEPVTDGIVSVSKTVEPKPEAEAKAKAKSRGKSKDTVTVQ